MKKLYKPIAVVLIIALIILTAYCVDPLPLKDKIQKLSYAETNFEVRIPTALNMGESILLEILDEVTGIALNPERFKMESKDGLTFSLKLPLAIGSVIRYRYVKNGQNGLIEKDPAGNQVHYRLYSVSDASVVQDLVTSWDPTPYQGITGELSGYIFDEKTEAPLAEIMVAVNGMRTFSSSDGFFKFPRVPLGEFHLTAVHPDGKYQVFQQNAIIAENSITPASFGMSASKIVKVKFVVDAPEGTDPSAAIRLLGNTFSLGNTFAEITGGASISSSRAPILNARNDAKFEIELQLPSGTDLRYKYSLGNGFINAEHDANNNFLTRQLIVPSKDTTINDSISTWFSKGTNPVNFVVSAPENTPANDFVSIQFNPYVWLDPISMWKTGENQWAYTLYSPFEYLENSQYRFCRNNQCGAADDEMTKGKEGGGYQLSLQKNQPLKINYQLANWFGLQPIQYGLQPLDFPASSTFFIKGFQLDNSYDRNWLPAMDSGMIDMGVSGANWLFFSPTWTFSKTDLASSGLTPGSDVFSADIVSIKDKALAAGITLAIYPQINTKEPFNDFWSSIGKSFNWWNTWFDQYERFIINYVDFSEAHGINTIIIGGRSASAGFPGGRLPDGNFSNTPYEFNDRWIKLFEKIRSRFSGQIGFAIPYSSYLDNAPQAISAADFIYLEFDSSLASANTPSVSELESSFDTIVDKDFYKLYATFQKPVILSISYPSIDGSASNCINSGFKCSDLPNSPVDVTEQADIYQAILRSSVTKPWIYGLVSDGFNPAAAVQDSSPSINGKPAFQVLSYFFNNLK